ncbi:MAG: sulfate adenylyltransferase subunit CysN [Hyphomicrobiales bacterium]
MSRELTDVPNPSTEHAKSANDDVAAAKGLLRFITCGSVDDGKSTLVGRMLFDSGQVYEDHLAALVDDSRHRPSLEDGLDFSLLVDGLQAEREQGITIDVAHRFFSTPRRTFIVADTPGHEQYTRNMVTGASMCDLCVVLIDARKGVLTQTRRHAFIASLMGIRHVVGVVNKMDLVDYDQATFDKITKQFSAFAKQIGLPEPTMVPVSALKGENVAKQAQTMDWYDGLTLLAHLESVDIDYGQNANTSFRFPVQWVNRPNLDFRGFSGTVASGSVCVGDTIVVASSKVTSRVRELHTFDGVQDRADTGQAITIVLDDEVDISRGDVLCHSERAPEPTEQFQAHIVWMSNDALIPGRSFILMTGTNSVSASITGLRYSIDLNSMNKLAAQKLNLNDLGVVNIATDRPVVVEPYAENRVTGSFILVDRMTNATVGAGMIDHGLRRAHNLAWQAFDVDRQARAVQKNQTPTIVWFTGLSGAGKSTIANHVERMLHAQGKHVYVLDGDNVRHGLNKDLGFKDFDRVENIRRVAEVARLMADAGLIVLVSFISPFSQDRRLAREVADDINFLEVFVDVPFSVAEDRDAKGLYARARAGEIPNFTGIDSPYQPPERPNLRLDTVAHTPQHLAERVVEALETVSINTTSIN